MKKMKPKLCGKYRSNHPNWKGQPSYTCKGCLNWDPIADGRGFVIGKTMNCYNFLEVKENEK